MCPVAWGRRLPSVLDAIGQAAQCVDVSRATSIMSDDRAGVHSPTTAMAPRCEQRWTVVAGFPCSSLVGRTSGGASRRDKRAGRFGGSSLLRRGSTFYTRASRTEVPSFVHSGPSWAVSGGECADMAWVLCAGPTRSHAVVESAAIVRAKGATWRRPCGSRPALPHSTTSIWQCSRFT